MSRMEVKEVEHHHLKNHEAVQTIQIILKFLTNS